MHDNNWLKSPYAQYIDLDLMQLSGEQHRVVVQMSVTDCISDGQNVLTQAI